MPSDTRLGTVDDVLGGLDPAVVAIAARLRAAIISIDPGATEQPRPGDRALSYGVGPKKMIEGYAYIMPQKGYVNLGFYHGVSLPDPHDLLEGTGKALRHVKIHRLEQVDETAVTDLIAAAVAERREALGVE